MNKKILLNLILLLLSGNILIAQDLLISPRRVVFEGSTQKEELNLVNIGKDTAIFVISFVQYRMNEDGSMQIINKQDSGQLFADPYLRVFPRKVILAPREPQVLMLQCRRKSDMQDGEYRSHLYFRAEKENSPLGMEKPAGDSSLMAVQLIPIYGMSIPIIIRNGESKLNCSISDIKINKNEDGFQYINFKINRVGNISSYGDIIIDYLPLNGVPSQIAEIKGIGVYTNLNSREMSVRINSKIKEEFIKGKIKIRYIDNNRSKSVVYAENEMEIIK